MPFLPKLDPFEIMKDMQEHIRKLEDIQKKGTKSEYWNEMYLYGGIHRYGTTSVIRKSIFYRLIHFFKRNKKPVNSLDAPV